MDGAAKPVSFPEMSGSDSAFAQMCSLIVERIFANEKLPGAITLTRQGEPVKAHGWFETVTATDYVANGQ